MALRLLSPFKLGFAPGDVTPGSARHLHLVAEAVKASYRARAELEGAEAAATLLDAATVSRLAESISLDSIYSEPLERGARSSESCTSHFCVGDAEGNVVSQTQTVRSLFGSGVCDPATGVVLNDSVGDFSLQPGEVTTQGISYRGNYNLLRPGAEPASSQSPLVAVHPASGDVIAVGAAGGPRIVSATLQALSNQIDFGMNAPLATAFPRVHSHGQATELEPDHPAAQALAALGHHVEETAQMGIAQTIRRRGGAWEGGADPRGPGGVSIVVEKDGQTTLRSYGYRATE